jgi:hypothetical protein
VPIPMVVGTKTRMELKQALLDDKIVRLEGCAKRGVIGTFKIGSSQVSPLSGYS